MPGWKALVRLMSGVALTGTFIRLLHVLHLPAVFLLLPLSISCLPWILKYIPGLQVSNLVHLQKNAGRVIEPTGTSR